MEDCETNNKIKNQEDIDQEKNESIVKFYNELDSIKDINFKVNFTYNTIFCGHPPIPINIIFESMKSVCKVTQKYKSGTGFFINIYNSKKYLFVSNLFFDKFEKNFEDSEIEIQIYNNKKMKFQINNRDCRNLSHPLDMSLIEIKDTDEICNNVKFLYYEFNYEKESKIYKDGYVFTIEHINGENAACASGKIIDFNKHEFTHTISTDKGSSGCPILLLNNSIEVIRVIGIHISKNISKNNNYGAFIGEILKANNIDNNIIIKFTSIDQLINVPISCKITDSFETVESKLYIEFPNLRNKNICFLANGNLIDRKATLEKNKIKGPTSILIVIND